MSRNSGNCQTPCLQSNRRFRAAGRMCSAAAAFALLIAIVTAGSSLGYAPDTSEAAAARCAEKVDTLEGFAAKAGAGKKQTTRITQEELNSYLALDLSPKYHPCLKSLVLTIEEGEVKGDASIDFDRLGLNATKLLAKIMASMFTGTHILSAQGKVIAQNGKANFQLESARFDSTTLPNFLVEEIITAVGKKQKPPFDPMKPSQMPYRIEKVDLHPGYIVIYQ